VLAIIERRLDHQMEQKLHCTALLLNPSKFFGIQDTNKRLTTKLHSMFNDVLWKMEPDDDLQSKISNLADDYERRLATKLHSMFNYVLWKMEPDDDLQSKIKKKPSL
jgi:uncharacterized lipoprotein YajG